MSQHDISEMIGATITSITGAREGSDEIVFNASDGRRFVLYHEQGCCEDVRIEDVCGDVSDLIESPIRVAEETSSDNYDPNCEEPKLPYACDSYTWTFYRFATAKGHVTIRWFGSSNGYYSESVDFKVIQ